MIRDRYISRLGLVAALAGLLFINQQAGAHYLAPSDAPNFKILLQAEPIVVVASVEKLVGSSKTQFEAIPGDYDSSPAFSEEYYHYRLSTLKLLKGKLPGTFDLRLIGGSRNHVLVDRAMGREILLVLAPDSGMDQQGKPRETYLITYGAAFLVRGGQFQVVVKGGSETWSIEQASDAIGQFEKERDRRRAESPEVGDAVVGVFSGEAQPDKEEKMPPEGPTLRKGVVLPPDVLAKAAPKAVEGAGDVKILDQKTGN